MTLIEEICRLLHELGLGTYDEAGGGNIFHLRLPDTPDEALAVARYAGGESDSKLGIDQANIQIRVRGTRNDSRTGETRAQVVYDALHGLGSRTLPGGTWCSLVVANQAGPVYLSRDQNDRDEWAVNARFDLARTTANRV